jgi:hypothetical protein
MKSRIRSDCHRAYINIFDTEDGRSIVGCEVCGRECHPKRYASNHFVEGDEVATPDFNKAVVAWSWKGAKGGRALAFQPNVSKIYKTLFAERIELLSDCVLARSADDQD